MRFRFKDVPGSTRDGGSRPAKGGGDIRSVTAIEAAAGARDSRVGRRLGSLVLAALLVAAACLSGVAYAEKGQNGGTFVDRSGKRNTWSVTPSHLLMWNGQPYAPVGVVLRSEYLRQPSEETLRQDLSELDRLRAAGVRDLWIDPQRGLLANAPSDTQKLVDAVEERGFRYGLRIGDRPPEPLYGYEPGVDPIAVPATRLQPGAKETWTVKAPKARNVAYHLVDLDDPREAGQPPIHNSTLGAGVAPVAGDEARVEVQISKRAYTGKRDGILLVVPETQVDPKDVGSFGELWAGMDNYATKLRSHLKTVKFGSGFRFLLDPFVAGDGTLGMEENVFPSSDSFRKGFAEWLQRRSSIVTLNTNWRVRESRIPGWAEAGRLIPMWSRNDPPVGDGWLFDPVDRVAYRCRPSESNIWRDLDDFRADTLKRWMNTLASEIKKDGVDVPVVYTWTNYHPVFNNTPSPFGYDGFGAEVYGSADKIAPASGAYALAQAEESDRYSWLLATRMAGERDSSGQPQSVSNSETVRAMWSALRDAGFRGVFLDPKQVSNAGSVASDLAKQVEADAAVLQQRPRVCFFPMPLSVSDQITRLSTGAWWLPSSKRARVLRYGDAVLGYEIDYPLGEDPSMSRATVLWAPSGEQEMTFYRDPFNEVLAFDSVGTPVKLKRNKKEIKMTIGPEPVLLIGANSDLLFPMELVVTQIREFQALLKEAERQRIQVQPYRIILEETEKSFTPATAALVYNNLQPHVIRLREALQPILWLEFERGVSHNFSGIVYQAGASENRYLRLDRGELPRSGTYQVRLRFDVRRDGSYDIWLAGRAPGQEGVSPLWWQLDRESPVEVRTAQAVGKEYAPGMSWFNVGRVALRVGTHELVLQVLDKAPGADSRYIAGLDAAVLSQVQFEPDGVRKPRFTGPEGR